LKNRQIQELDKLIQILLHNSEHFAIYNIIDNAFQHGGKNVKLDIMITGDTIIFQDNEISRILSSKPLKIVKIDFDDKSKEEDNAESIFDVQKIYTTLIN
jgi:hypothetical protein